MSYKKWVVKKVDRKVAQNLAAECDTDPFIALLALSQGIAEPEELDEFLSDDIILSSPYDLPDMKKAVDEIKQAITDDILIAVFGDYDCDGITATALLYRFLQNFGARCVYYIPDRLEEGYGMSKTAVDKLYNDGVGMIITVDNGIACVDEIEYAKTLGIKIVVTDHHLPPEKLPDAAAIVDPHLDTSNTEFKDVCGVFVAFKLVCAVAGKEPEEIAEQYADLVSIGTVADIMPLRNENRDIVKLGLRVLNTTKNAGITALINAAGLKKGEITSTKISFGIAPRINAAGRMGSAELALKLLLTDDVLEACRLAEMIDEQNALRQQTEQQILSQAVSIIEDNGYCFDKVVVVSGKGWHHGVVGIVAARIAERYGKPSVVISEDGEFAIGSARSVGDFSIFECLSFASDLLSKFGGHKGAAGLSLKTENINDLRKKLNDYAARVKPAIPQLTIACKLNPAGLSLDIVDAIMCLEPFGAGNPTPVFGLYGLKIDRITPIGGGKHLRLLFSKNGNAVSAVMFGTPQNRFAFCVGDAVDIAVALDKNEYGGKQTLGITVKNIRPCSLDDDELFEQIECFDDLKKSVSRSYSVISRDDVGKLYKMLESGMGFDAAVLKAVPTMGFFKARAGMEVLTELDLIRVNSGDIEVVKGTHTQLDNSATFRFLKG